MTSRDTAELWVTRGGHRGIGGDTWKQGESGKLWITRGHCGGVWVARRDGWEV